ncbi:helix-turn-helix domain-containing protein [Arthrobacter sp. LAPM80]|uniref:helix-turn-helix domain-containing protein n=1 Tax=Arthrobacter sp. LAPM80 TaxID=3141788 RepID=UPI00398A96AB
MTTEEAAQELAATRAMVHKLLKNGSLLVAGRAGRSILIDSASVQRYKNRRTLKGRSWNAATAWAALNIIEGGTPGWIDATARYRIKQRLKIMDPAELAAAVGTKDEVKRYRIAPAGIPRAADYFLPTGTTALNDSVVAERFGLAAGRTDILEGYVDSVRAPMIVNGLSLVEDPAGNIIVHIVDDGYAFEGPGTPDAVIAVDLMESLNSRERAAGKNMLEKIFTQWKEANGG